MLKSLLSQKNSRTKMIMGFIIAVLIIIIGVLLGTSLNSKNSSSSVVQYLEKVNEVVFLNVGAVRVEAQQNNITIPWTNIGVPLTEKKAIIIINYKAKLGIKEPAKIEEISEKKYKIKIPQYKVIGIELDKEYPYYLYDSSGGLLSIATPNVDTGKLLAQVLSIQEQEKFIDKYTEDMNSSAIDYYTKFFKSMDETIEVEFEFIKK